MSYRETKDDEQLYLLNIKKEKKKQKRKRG